MNAKPLQVAAASALLAALHFAVAAAAAGAAVASTAPVERTATVLVATVFDRYLAGLATLRSEFTQTSTDSRGRAQPPLSGTLLISRPGRFRWEIRSSASAVATTQLMVADGRNVWFYDRELEQVTVRGADAALTATPAMLLSGGVDPHAAFDIRAGARVAGLDTVLVKPLRADAEFRQATLSFSGAELKRMSIVDKLGQTTTLQFTKSIRNGAVNPAELVFTPPPGVDVIGTPLAVAASPDSSTKR